MFIRTGVNGTALAILENLRGNIAQTKVIRYWPGKAPEWADDADKEGDIRTTRALEIALSSHEGKRQRLDVVERAGCDWSGMPLDILRNIAGLIDEVEDYIRFGAVCKSWQSATFSSYDDCPKSSKRRLEYPWLMLVQNNPGDKRGFYNFLTGKKFYMELPEIHGSTCFGTPCGWLVTVDRGQKLHLLNPLTRKYLPLPSLPLSAAFVEKASVVWDGDTPIVFLIYRGSRLSTLAMSRPGDSCWTTVDHPCGSEIENIDLFRGQVLVLTVNEIHIVDLSVFPPRLKEFATAPCPWVHGQYVFLVDTGGDLHALSPRFMYKGFRGKRVKNDCLVFKLDMVERRWEEVHNLGGWTAFVGLNSPSFALPSSTDYPLCKPNCIYSIACLPSYTTSLRGSGWRVFSVETPEETRAANEGVVGRRPSIGGMRSKSAPVDQFSICCFSPNLWR